MMVKNFDMLKNKRGIIVGGQYLLSMIEKPLYLTQDIIAYSMGKI